MILSFCCLKQKATFLVSADIFTLLFGPPGLILGTSFHNTHTTKESAAETTEGKTIKRAGEANDVARAVYN